jgi:sRNA-binding regulator protein Hfq
LLQAHQHAKLVFEHKISTWVGWRRYAFDTFS